jgi:hypothetical protein
MMRFFLSIVLLSLVLPTDQSVSTSLITDSVLLQAGKRPPRCFVWVTWGWNSQWAAGLVTSPPTDAGLAYRVGPTAISDHHGKLPGPTKP